MLDVTVNRLDGQPLEPKHVQVLLALGQAYPDTLSVERLMDVVWSDVVVGDNVVHQAIRQLRQVFNDDARQPSVIQTVPRKGYRLMVEMLPADAAQPLDARRRAKRMIAGVAAVALVIAVLLALVFLDRPRPQLEGSTVIAVLDPVDISTEAAPEWLATGLGVELRDQLDRLEGIDTLPRAMVGTASMSQLSQQADLIIDATLNKQGSGLQAHVELTDLNSRSLVWRGTFAASNDDTRELLRQISTGISRYFKATVVDLRGPQNPAAYDSYLKYLHQQWGGNPDEELHWLRRALDEDPQWVQGWGDLASHLRLQAAWRRNTQDVDAAWQALARARELTGDVAWGWNTDASLRAYWQGDLMGAEETLRRYGDPLEYAFLLLNSGLCREAQALLLELAERSPYHAGTWDSLAMTHACTGNAAGAVNAATHALSLMPQDSFRASFGLIWGLPRLGRIEEARALLDRMSAHIAGSKPGTMDRRLKQRSAQLLAYEIAAVQGDRAAALSAAEWFEATGDHVFAGILYLRLEDGRAIQQLRLALEPPLADRFLWAWRQPFIPPELRAHPDIEALSAAMGFTPEWRAELCARSVRFSFRPPLSCGPRDFLIAR